MRRLADPAHTIDGVRGIEPPYSTLQGPTVALVAALFRVMLPAAAHRSWRACAPAVAGGDGHIFSELSVDRRHRPRISNTALVRDTRDVVWNPAHGLLGYLLNVGFFADRDGRIALASGMHRARR